MIALRFALLQGATVRNEGDSVVIARILKGGMADKLKFLKPGRRTVSV